MNVFSHALLILNNIQQINIYSLFAKNMYIHMKLNHFVSVVSEMQLKRFVIFKRSFRYVLTLI